VCGFLHRRVPGAAFKVDLEPVGHSTTNKRRTGMKAWTVSVAIVLASTLTAGAAAQCCAGMHKGDQMAAKTADGPVCHHKDSEAAAAQRSKLLTAAGAPLMQYKVGDKTTNCPQQAAEWSKDQDAPVRYVLNDTEYSDKLEALKAYQAALEQHLNKMTTVLYAVGDKCVGCPMEAATLAKGAGTTVKYRVASFTFPDREAANRAAQTARAASDKVTMTYVVDGKEYGCDKEAKQTCQSKAGASTVKTVEYKVGDTKTCCEVTAKVQLATERIIAAYQALADNGTQAKADQQAGVEG
jgi:hypothetical protein